MSPRRMRIAIPLKNLDSNVFAGQNWIIDRFPSDVTAEASHTALYDFLVAPMDGKKKGILGIAGDGVVENSPLQLRRVGRHPSSAEEGSLCNSSTLNPCQQEAIDR